jgi:hypothetical protein
MAGFPFTPRIRVLHPAPSALSSFRDIVVPSYTLIGGLNYTLCVHRSIFRLVRSTILKLRNPSRIRAGLTFMVHEYFPQCLD